MSRSKAFSGFSWADEVEKDEKQEEEADLTELLEEQRPNSKLNPFGSARPREVVLEEKGVDWRKLDQQLDQPPNLREEKQLKENLRPTQAPVNKNGIIARPRCSEISQAQSARKVSGLLSTPPVLANQHKENLHVFVPALKYPPRNAIEPELLRMGYHQDRLKMGWENSQHSRHLTELNMKRQRDNLSAQRSILGDPRTVAHYMMNMEKRNKREMENMEPEFGTTFAEKRLMCLPTNVRTRSLPNATTEKASFTRYREREVRAANKNDLDKIGGYYGRRNFVKQRSLVQPIQAPVARKYQEKGLRAAVQENNRDNMGVQC